MLRKDSISLHVQNQTLNIIIKYYTHMIQILSYWTVNLFVTNTPKREGKCDELELLSSCKSALPDKQISLQTELRN